MNRQECEEKIAEKLREIVDIYHQYNPDGKYLAMAYLLSDEYESISANNRYWQDGEDQVMKIDYSSMREVTTDERLAG